MILMPLQKLPNNMVNLGKIIVSTRFEWLPKKQKITQSGHTASINYRFVISIFRSGHDQTSDRHRPRPSQLLANTKNFFSSFDDENSLNCDRNIATEFVCLMMI